MLNWKSLPALIGATLIIAVIAYIAFYFVFLDLFVNLWWFESLNFEGYFWLRLLYRFFLSGGVTLVFFGIFFFHFWIASRYLGLNPPDEVLLDMDKRQRFQRFAEVFMNGSVKFYSPLALLLAIIIAVPFYNQWETALLFLFGSDSGTADPVYGNDISFYLLSYPVLLLIQQELLLSSVILFFMVACLYWLEHIFVPNQGKSSPIGAKIHLGILLGFVVLFVILGFMLDRYSLLLVDRNEPVFYGPGFTELRWHLPLIWLSIVSFLALSVTGAVAIFSEKHRGKMPLMVSGAAFLVVLMLQNSDYIPELIDKYIVKPNPVRVESRSMLNNIEATLAAYNLKNIHVIDAPIKLNAAEDIQNWSSQNHFENIPVWDREFLIDGYQQLQAIRAYYNFFSVDEDRYFLNGHNKQVNLAAREISISKLPPEAQNWENIHMRYTHGYGAVVTPAAQDAAKPIIWYLRDLNLYSEVGFNVRLPDIYYGLEDYTYSIIPNDLKKASLSSSDRDETSEYQGNGGIPISSYFRKLLLAFHFKDEKIFFSSNISKDSKIQLRRNIIERVQQLTPYIHLDKDPYLVITPDRFYWVLDAYTLSRYYPVSKMSEETFPGGSEKFNYIRNSLKITVDAYDGEVNYYIADTTDPIVQAYNRAYPGVFKKLEEMPGELSKHLRYPRDLFYQQMKIYAKYHQQTPDLFYQQAETRQFAIVHNNVVLPYYQTMDFGNCNDQEEFVLLNPMTPINRGNLSLIGMASVTDKDKCANNYQPHITVYKFPKDTQVNGPAQVEALIDQDPFISEQVSLWDQRGSTVEFGRMVILPMGNTVLYVQPLYLTSTKTRIPELTRVLVSIGNEIVMDTTLSGALNRLKQKFLQRAQDTKGSGTTSPNTNVEAITIPN